MHGQRRLDRHDELWCRQDGATGCGHDCRDCLCRGDGSSCEGGCGCGRGSRCGSGRCGEEEANASGNGSGSANRSCGGGSGNASRGFEAWASGSGCGCEIDSVRGRGQGNARIEEIASASARPWLQSGRVAGARPWEVGGWEVAERDAFAGEALELWSWHTRRAALVGVAASCRAVTWGFPWRPFKFQSSQLCLFTRPQQAGGRTTQDNE